VGFADGDEVGLAARHVLEHDPLLRQCVDKDWGDRWHYVRINASDPRYCDPVLHSKYESAARCDCGFHIHLLGSSGCVLKWSENRDLCGYGRVRVMLALV
jgi:hypothetical protein